MGASAGIGTTHFVLLLSNYLTGFKRKPTAVLEWNRHGDFCRLGKVCLGQSKPAEHYRILGADYFPGANEETLIKCMNGPFAELIFDYGREEDGGWTGLIRCHKKILIVSFSEWQIEAAIRLFQKPKPEKEGWYYFASFGSDESRKEAERRLGLSVWKVPYLPDAYGVTKETISLFGRLWK